jgi:tetratricopeptide (TPR) repeat protein
MDQARVLQEKQKGNECFAKKDYLGAIEHYTKALELDPTNIVLLSNRAQCFLCLER